MNPALGEINVPATRRAGPSIGSLCSGYGGLELGVQAALGGTVAWHADIDRGAADILARHWPTVPNLGDITTINWTDVPRVCILTAGFPCQRRLCRRPPCRAQSRYSLRAVAARRPRGRGPASLPGGDRECPGTPHLPRRNPWRHGTLPVVCGRRPSPTSSAGTWRRTRLPGRPPVRRTLARATRLRHRGTRRERIFLAAWPADDPTQDPDQQYRRQRWEPASGKEETRWPRAEPGRRGGVATADPDGAQERDWCGTIRQEQAGIVAGRGPSPVGRGESGHAGHERHWGPYAAAITRWEKLTRPAPPPTDAAGRLSTNFVEWMQGLPAGWVTATPGLSRRAQLLALGNGVIPQQAACAVQLLAPIFPRCGQCTAP